MEKHIYYIGRTKITKMSILSNLIKNNVIPLRSPIFFKLVNFKNSYKTIFREFLKWKNKEEKLYIRFHMYFKPH